MRHHPSRIKWAAGGSFGGVDKEEAQWRGRHGQLERRQIVQRAPRGSLMMTIPDVVRDLVQMKPGDCLAMRLFP